MKPYRYLTREQWGHRTDLPRLGATITPSERTEGFIHHVVAIDTDASPNVWETDAECFIRMRGLQTARPDLGLDVPYNFVAFLMEGELLICEGRGAQRYGAHTQWHNRTGIALSFYGNFQNYATLYLEAWLPAAGAFFYDLKMGLVPGQGPALPNLGSVYPPDRDVFGHREATDTDGNNVSGGTSCPGRYLFDLLSYVRLQPFGGDDMALSDEDLAKIQAGVAVELGHKWRGYSDFGSFLDKYMQSVTAKLLAAGGAGASAGAIVALIGEKLVS